VSRIHDALRHGQRGAAPRAVQRTAQADAVLAALGYRAERPYTRVVLLLAATLAALALILVLAYAPTTTSAPSAGADPSSNGAGIKPASAPPRLAVAQAFRIGQSAVSPSDPVSPPPIAPPAPPPAADVSLARAEGRSVSIPTTAREGANLVAVTADARPIRTAGRVSASSSSDSTVGTPPPSTAGSMPAHDANDFQVALYHQRSGDFEQALLQYQKVLQHDPLNVEAHNNLGILYQDKGLYEDAAREFQRVLAINPSYVTAHLNLSAAYLQLGRPDAAAAQARAALATDPRQSDALVNLALAQDAAGQPGDAQLSLRRALEITPSHPAAHYNLAQVYERTGELALAIEHYREFLQFAGPRQAGYVADARARLQALARGNK
jgi:Tfp pilus assembly protein PilF